jgi:acetyl-CoA synthetase
LLKFRSTYEEVYNAFQWAVPEYYNIGVDICDKWAPQRDRLALICDNEKGQKEQ